MKSRDLAVKYNIKSGQVESVIREHSERSGEPYPETQNKDMVKEALSSDYNQKIIVDQWELPSGAFGDSCGPL